MSQPYLWLRQLLAQALPELEDLPVGQEGQTRAEGWFGRLLVRFAERGLVTPAQQKNRVVDVRNAIRARFGDEHPALAFVGFDEQTWQEINLPTHDRTEARNENQRLLRDPERIVERAATLLASPRFEDLAVGLGVTIGRRMSELLDGHARLEAATAWSVTFTGQRKHRGNREDFAFEIPTLAPAADVLEAWKRLQVMLGDQVLDPQTINNRYGHQVNQAAERHFHGLVPARLPQAAASNGQEDQASDPLARERRGDALYLHLFRAVYATIAVHWFCPPRVNRLVYKAEIQGHRQILDAPTATMRRSYAASRHYDDYQVADASGENIDGRQGIKLGVLPGLEVLRAFQPSRPQPELPAPAAPPAPPAPPDNTFVFPSPPAATTAAMDPANTPAATNESPSALPAAPAESSAIEAGTPATPKAKKPRPGTYRIHAADRPRLDAFRLDPKQSQADNLQSVITRAEEAAQAMQSHQQALEDLQAAQERAEEAKQAGAQAHQEAETLRGQCTAQVTEIQQLQQTLAQERTQASAATAPVDATGSSLATAILARELLALATGGECPPTLQARLIGLATQALGGSAAPGPHPVIPMGSTSPKRNAKATVDPARYGPLFAAGGQSPHPSAPVGGTAATTSESSTGAQTSPTSGAEAATPSGGSDRGEGDTPAPPGATEILPASPTAPQVDRRRGGATDKLARAFAAVLAHNQAQSTRERKWALTETAIARLTGCFRPAVRRFFDEHAQEVEEHNARHHLTGGHNAARGKRGQTIEGEIAWRDTPALASLPPTAGTPLNKESF